MTARTRFRSQAAVGRAVLVASLVAALAHPAAAGLLDTPAPAFTGGAGRVIYRMGPVHFDPGWVETFVACTNVGNAPTEIALEVFDEADAPAGGVARATVAPGARAAFAVSAGSEAARAENAILVSGVPALEHGKARVSSPSAALACKAWHRIGGADGTVKEGPLELVKKVAIGG
jgi:hypothetical protein